MFCKNCGIKLDDDSIFCVSCGTKVSMPPPANGNPQPMQSQQEGQSVVPPVQFNPVVPPVQFNPAPMFAQPTPVFVAYPAPKQDKPRWYLMLLCVFVPWVALILCWSAAKNNCPESHRLYKLTGIIGVTLIAVFFGVIISNVFFGSIIFSLPL